MPDTPLERAVPPPYNPDHEVRITRLEADVHDIKAMLAQMVPTLARIDSMLTATLPHLATKAELAELSAKVDHESAGLNNKVDQGYAVLNGKIDQGYAALNGKIDQGYAALNNKTDQGYTALNGKIDQGYAALNSKVDQGYASLHNKIDHEIGALRTEFKADTAAIRTDTAAIMATLAHVATKAELAEKPSKSYLWGVLAVLVATYGCGLATVALLAR